MTHNYEWLKSEQCRRLSFWEAAIVQQLSVIQHLPLALVVGDSQQINWVHYITANHVYFKTTDPRGLEVSDQDLIVQARSWEFPFLPKTLNLAILPHTLNYYHNPNQLLAQLTPCLRDDGYLVIFLFERWSPLSIHQVWQKSSQPRVCPYFHSALMIKRYLKDWEYRLLSETKYFFNLPKASANNMLKYFNWMGDVRMLVAQREEVCITSLKERWRDKAWQKGSVPVKRNQHKGGQ